MKEESHQLEEQLVQAWEFGDPAGSERIFRDRADKARGSAERAVWMTQAARAQGLIGDFDGAHLLLDQIAAESGAETSAHVRARMTIERGRVLNSSGAPAEALAEFEQAVQAAHEAGLEGLEVDALHMTAIALGQTAGPVESAAANQRAMSVAEASVDSAARRWRASLLNNLGALAIQQPERLTRLADFG